jgi:hypothetical protein
LVTVNAAILLEYGGSNLGVPVTRVRALLNDQAHAECRGGRIRRRCQRSIPPYANNP